MLLINKLILGTVQLGLPYGINNTAGKPDLKEAFKILDIAKQNGITMLDTAEAYGDAIEIIGKYHLSQHYRFNIISKFKYIPGQNIEKNIQKTLNSLYIDHLFAYLLHDADAISETKIKSSFYDLKSSGLIKNSGVSIYTNKQFEKAIFTDYIDIIQIPYNILDNERQRGALIKEAKRNGKQIHVRSVFLQGLFFMQENKMSEKLLPLKKYLTEIDALSKNFGFSK